MVQEGIEGRILVEFGRTITIVYQQTSNFYFFPPF